METESNNNNDNKKKKRIITPRGIEKTINVLKAVGGVVTTLFGVWKLYNKLFKSNNNNDNDQTT